MDELSTQSAEGNTRRAQIRQLLHGHKDTISRARRVYFDSSSYALTGKHEIEFAIKSKVASFFGLPFRSVVFSGSAQLGFSPHKDTEFVVGQSDLDIACIDSGLFQKYWQYVLKTTRAFNDLSKFSSPKNADDLKDQLLKRGMIYLNYLPNGDLRKETFKFLNELTVENRSYFKSVTIALYINEYTFCWKQGSALTHIMGSENAE